MKLLVFDPFNGIAGDMTLGALFDLGVPPDVVQGELKKLPLEGYRLEVEEVRRRGIRAVNAHVILEPDTGVKRGNHRGFTEIRDLILESKLTERVRRRAVRIFECLGRAEARVHGTSLEDVHFHEVGALDAVVDIVGSCVGFEFLGVERFHTRTIHLGGGEVTFSHGTWRVPAPATAELLKGFPVRLGENEGELTTPTGAAIIAALVEPGSPGSVRLLKAGYGAGDREVVGLPNVLRLLLGEVGPAAGQELAGDVALETVLLLQAAVDDATGELVGRYLELALEHGALDTFLTPIQMKKSRPGQLISVLCRPEDEARLVDLLFRETTTLGVRRLEQERWVLPRRSAVVPTPWGDVRCKVALYGKSVLRVMPEFEDVHRTAALAGRSFQEIRRQVLERANEMKLWENSSI
ncbi:MAG TPA: nickel pincer cofactor biosynthesis protein LarC [Acidobacteriota bacterium]|nr:nickel pincer cofactor biosynthesis protein LarC [Acidobacteriota bacterium]HRR25671.1 nickel pincer cofactor biosynthesis protein LarC [Acidobacteriota bacterium]